MFKYNHQHTACQLEVLEPTHRPPITMDNWHHPHYSEDPGDSDDNVKHLRCSDSSGQISVVVDIQIRNDHRGVSAMSENRRSYSCKNTLPDTMMSQDRQINVCHQVYPLPIGRSPSKHRIANKGQKRHKKKNFLSRILSKLLCIGKNKQTVEEDCYGDHDVYSKFNPIKVSNVTVEPVQETGETQCNFQSAVTKGGHTFDNAETTVMTRCNSNCLTDASLANGDDVRNEDAKLVEDISVQPTELALFYDAEITSIQTRSSECLKNTTNVNGVENKNENNSNNCAISADSHSSHPFTNNIAEKYNQDEKLADLIIKAINTQDESSEEISSIACSAECSKETLSADLEDLFQTDLSGSDNIQDVQSKAADSETNTVCKWFDSGLDESADCTGDNSENNPSSCYPSSLSIYSSPYLYNKNDYGVMYFGHGEDTIEVSSDTEEEKEFEKNENLHHTELSKNENTMDCEKEEYLADIQERVPQVHIHNQENVARTDPQETFKNELSVTEMISVHELNLSLERQTSKEKGYDEQVKQKEVQDKAVQTVTSQLDELTVGYNQSVEHGEQSEKHEERELNHDIQKDELKINEDESKNKAEHLMQVQQNAEGQHEQDFPQQQLTHSLENDVKDMNVEEKQLLHQKTNDLVLMKKAADEDELNLIEVEPHKNAAVFFNGMNDSKQDMCSLEISELNKEEHDIRNFIDRQHTQKEEVDIMNLLKPFFFRDFSCCSTILVPFSTVGKRETTFLIQDLRAVAEGRQGDVKEKSMNIFRPLLQNKSFPNLQVALIFASCKTVFICIHTNGLQNGIETCVDYKPQHLIVGIGGNSRSRNTCSNLEENMIKLLSLRRRDMELLPKEESCVKQSHNLTSEGEVKDNKELRDDALYSDEAVKSNESSTKSNENENRDEFKFGQTKICFALDNVDTSAITSEDNACKDRKVSEEICDNREEAGDILEQNIKTDCTERLEDCHTNESSVVRETEELFVCVEPSFFFVNDGPRKMFKSRQRIIRKPRNPKEKHLSDPEKKTTYDWKAQSTSYFRLYEKKNTSKKGKSYLKKRTSLKHHQADCLYRKDRHSQFSLKKTYLKAAPCSQSKRNTRQQPYLPRVPRPEMDNDAPIPPQIPEDYGYLSNTLTSMWNLSSWIQSIASSSEESCHSLLKNSLKAQEDHIQEEILNIVSSLGHFIPAAGSLHIAPGLEDYFTSIENGENVSIEEQMRIELLRMSSFSQYRGDGSRVNLARNGFFFEPSQGPSGTRCEGCKCAYSDWNFFSDVPAIHKRLSPNCPYVTGLPQGNNDDVEPRSSNEASSTATAAIATRLADAQRTADVIPSRIAEVATNQSSNFMTSTSQGQNIAVTSMTGENSNSDLSPLAASSSEAVAVPKNCSALDELTSSLQQANLQAAEKTDQGGAATQPSEDAENDSLLRTTNLYGQQGLNVRNPLRVGRQNQSGPRRAPEEPSQPNNCPAILTEQGLSDLAAKIGEEWIMFFLCLQMPFETIQEIIERHGDQASVNTIKACLKRWKDSNSDTDEKKVDLISNSLNEIGRAELVAYLRQYNQDPQQSLGPNFIGAGPSASRTTVNVYEGTNEPRQVDIVNPRYPQYASVDVRISSFKGWPLALGLTARQMAEAGFFYAGVADFTRCFACGGGLRNWESGDDPCLEHTRWFPHCEYMKKLKGEVYVRNIKLRQQQHLERQKKEQEEEEARKNAAKKDLTTPVETDAGKILQGMGYTAERITSVIETLRKQTGKVEVSAEQALRYILDEDEGNTPVTVATPGRPPQASNQKGATGSLSSATAARAAESLSTATAKSSDSQASSSGESASVQSKPHSRTQTSSPSLSSSSRSPVRNEMQGSANGKSGKKKKKKKGKNEDKNTNEATNLDPASLLEENERLKEMQKCKICMDNAVDTTLLPCGHLVLCSDCAIKVNLCPICRLKIMGTVRTFLS